MEQTFPSRGGIFFNGSIAAFIEVGVFELREAWAKRRYEAHFVSKLTDSDGENGETETWLDFARDCGYLPKRDHALFTEKCREVGAMLGSIIKDPSSFIQKS